MVFWKRERKLTNWAKLRKKINKASVTKLLNVRVRPVRPVRHHYWPCTNKKNYKVIIISQQIRYLRNGQISKKTQESVTFAKVERYESV